MAAPFQQKRSDRYISTRGGIKPVSFTEAVMMGLAPDGGLLLPMIIPQIHNHLSEWGHLAYEDLAFQVMSPFVGDGIRAHDLDGLIHRSYRAFSQPDVTPIVRVGDKWILELFHGPTASFKDVALQFLGNLFEYILEHDGGYLNILGATSGDTGSAAIHGVRNKKNINIFMLHPKGRVSPIQERQMTTVLDPNVHNIAINGTFDDGQRIVKTLFSNLELKEQFHLGAVNSINWARILAQVVYYFYAWGRVTGGDPNWKVSFAVPTGNFGDVFAGYVAKQMGLPINRLIIATNRNDIISRFVKDGVYEVGDVHPTLAPSMDIQVASNFERYLYYLLQGDPCPSVVSDFMDSVRRHGRVQVNRTLTNQVASDFLAGAVNDEGILARILETYVRDDYVLDPHTATAVMVAGDLPDVICLATAHPAKFDDAVREAIGTSANPPPCLEGLLEKETCSIELPAREAALEQYFAITPSRPDLTPAKGYTRVGFQSGVDPRFLTDGVVKPKLIRYNE